MYDFCNFLYLKYNNATKRKGVNMKKLLLTAAIAGFAFAGYNCGMCHNGGMAAKLDTMTPAEIVKKAKASTNSMMQNAIKGMSDADLKKAAEEFGKK